MTPKILIMLATWETWKTFKNNINKVAKISEVKTKQKLELYSIDKERSFKYILDTCDLLLAGKGYSGINKTDGGKCQYKLYSVLEIIFYFIQKYILEVNIFKHRFIETLI